jgi:hypothetical protein
VFDPYKILNVPYDVTAEALKARHRELAKKLHADSPGGSDELMKLVNQANDQIKLNLKNGTKFSPEPGTPDPDEPKPTPKENEHSRSDSQNSGARGANASRDQPRDDQPNDEGEPGPKWGADARTWDVGGGSYTTSSGTYSNRPYHGSRWQWWAGGGAAAIVLLVLMSSGSRTPAPEPVRLPPSPPPRTQITGYLHLNDLATGFSISAGQIFGFDLPVGRTQVNVVSGLVALVSLSGQTERPCSTQPFFVDVAANSFVTKTPFVSACAGEPSVLRVNIQGPAPTPEPVRPPPPVWTPPPSPPAIPNIAPGNTIGVQVVSGRTAFRILSGAVAASQTNGRLALTCTSANFTWTTTQPESPASFFAVSCNGAPAVVQVVDIAPSHPAVIWKSVPSAGVSVHSPGVSVPMQ